MRPWGLWDTPTKNGVVAKASTTMRARIVLTPPVRAEEGRGGLSESYDWAHRNSPRPAKETVPLVTQSPGNPHATVTYLRLEHHVDVHQHFAGRAEGHHAVFRGQPSPSGAH